MSRKKTEKNIVLLIYKHSFKFLFSLTILDHKNFFAYTFSHLLYFHSVGKKTYKN